MDPCGRYSSAAPLWLRQLRFRKDALWSHRTGDICAVRQEATLTRSVVNASCKRTETWQSPISCRDRFQPSAPARPHALDHLKDRKPGIRLGSTDDRIVRGPQDRHAVQEHRKTDYARGHQALCE